jgi:hypothetical protein
LSIKVEIPKDPIKLNKQLKALAYAIKHDKNEKDKQIHRQAYDSLLEAKMRG